MFDNIIDVDGQKYYTVFSNLENRLIFKKVDSVVVNNNDKEIFDNNLLLLIEE
jgi:hypothetical protein